MSGRAAGHCPGFGRGRAHRHGARFGCREASAVEKELARAKARIAELEKQEPRQ